MRVLVTGATGFVGRHLIPELLRRGVQVTASSRSPGKARDFGWFSQVEYVACDITQSGNLDVSIFGRPDILVHLAWAELDDFNSRVHTDALLPAHLNFLSSMIEAGLPQCVVAGTCLEYGKTEGELRESDPARPQIAYATAKNGLRLELSRMQKSSTFKLKWVRLFYLFGQGQNPKALLAQLDQALANGDAEFDMSPGDQLRDYLPIERAAELIARVSLNSDFDGIVNCCSGEPIAVRDLVVKYLTQSRREIKLNLGRFPYPDYEAKSFWGSTARLSEITEHVA